MGNGEIINNKKETKQRIGSVKTRMTEKKRKKICIHLNQNGTDEKINKTENKNKKTRKRTKGK